MFPLFLITLSALFFIILERMRPGRKLPMVPGWYGRAILSNLCQLGIVEIAGLRWNQWFQHQSIFTLPAAAPPVLQGLFIWLVGTFIFYWWHRLRHRNGFWQVFHQVHHSPSRIETLTSFYKHPFEMMVNSLIISLLIYYLFGGTLAVAGWYNFFAVIAEFFYHANITTPQWIGYLVQRPEHHSIHHQTEVHEKNFGDLTLWDKLFGTFQETDEFAKQCGFKPSLELQTREMLFCQDLHKIQKS